MEIVRGDSTYTGVKENENGQIVCEVCGSTKAKMTTHIDGAKFFSSSYECECGNAIGITTKRDKHDPMYY